MTHPFSWLSPGTRWLLLALLVAATVALAAALAGQARGLRSEPAAPEGLLSYEFAWTHDRVREIMLAWGPDLKETARACLVRDFAFLLVYPLLLSLACAIVAEVPDAPHAAAGLFLSWAVLAAMPIEAIENAGLIRMLGSGTHDLASDFVARVAGLCAGLKFALAFAAIGYVLLAELGLIANRLGLGRM